MNSKIFECASELLDSEVIFKSLEIHSRFPGSDLIPLHQDNAYYGQDEDPAYYAYDSLISHTYKGTSTVFFQDLAMKKYDVKKVVVFPSTPSTFNQAIIDKTKFRLNNVILRFGNFNASLQFVVCEKLVDLLISKLK